MNAQKNILVVGAGIIGASIALHLLRAGARVTVVDSAEPGGVATRNSWAWLNANCGNPRPYFSLRVRSMQDWRELERTVPGLRVAWIGSLNWEISGARLSGFVTEHASWGYDVRLLECEEILALEPALAEPPVFAAFAPTEGVVEPLQAARAILAEVARLGGTVVAHTPARALAVTGGRTTGISTDAGPIPADETVVAAGVGAAPLLATAGYALPLRHSPSLRAVSRPHAKLINHLLITPAAEIRQAPDGRVIACTGPDQSVGADAAAALHAAVERSFRAGDSLAWESDVVAHRPMPQDGFSIVGRIAGMAALYVAVTHSGITLAPAIGRFAAEEILAGHRDPLLAPFGPERFATKSS
jgi:glycine/D-amino acid oxidase-like deaminating enzyme